MFIQIVQFILMLSILIVLHELGHFIPAKLFKTKVEKFYLFFDPYFSLIKKKIGETEYGIGWLPLGGYVKIAGMIDESMDTEQMKQAPQPWEFRSKPAWQRLIIMLGGVTVNVLLAWVILAGIYSYWGQKYISLDKVQSNGLAFSQVAKEVGFQNGDKILTVDGKKQARFDRLVLDILLGEEVVVDRKGQQVRITLTDEQKGAILKKQGSSFISPRLPHVSIDSIASNTPAQAAKLQRGDIITAINGQPVTYFDELHDALEKHPLDSVQLTVQRGGQQMMIPPTTESAGKLGFFPKFDLKTDFQVVRKYNFFTAMPSAINESFNMLAYQIKQFKLIFKPKTEAYKQVKGPIGIIKVFPNTFEWEFFWSFTAMFSIWLAFLNILPIPGLDGGHALFAIVEAITGRTLHTKAMEIVQTIGMVFLFGLMILIFGKDLFDLIYHFFAK
jgi:regulator of sigma E protease